jgi:formate hydrogenlyase subunit 4
MPRIMTALRLPERTRKLMAAISERTGFSLTQVVIHAVEFFAEKYGITLPPSE